MTPTTRVCALSRQEIPTDDCIPCADLRPSLLQYIRKQHPTLTDDDCISRALLPELKAAFVEDALSDELGEITDLERDVIESLREHDIVSSSPTTEDTRTFGERLSDRMAEFGGSWVFILCFAGFLLLWILFNTLVWSAQPPDPYPFIFLNLLLSCLAAIQAPVIMMSQNRQETRDRQHAEEDYKVNLKAELEIRHLHEKIDHLLHHHSRRLLEIQQIQTDLLRQLLTERQRDPRPPAN